MTLRIPRLLALLLLLAAWVAPPASPQPDTEAAAPDGVEAVEAVDPATLPPEPPGEPAKADPRAAEGVAAARAAARAAVRRTEQVEANLRAVEEVLATKLSSGEAGELLREARRRAPEPTEEARRLDIRERQVAEARLNRVRLLERRRLADEAGDEAESVRLASELTQQQAWLTALQEAVEAERILLALSTELVTLLDGKLLWIGSAPPVGRAWLKDVVAGVEWGTRPVAWEATASVALQGAAARPLAAALWTLLVGALLFFRGRIKRDLVAMVPRIGRHRTDHYGLTVRALGLTVLLALPLPLILAGLSMALRAGPPDAFPREVAAGLVAAAGVAFALGFFGQVVRPGGLAEAHFGWDDAVRRTLQKHLSRLRWAEVPAALVVATTDAGGSEVLRQGLGRAAFLFGSVVLTGFVAVVFRPERGVLAALSKPGDWAHRLRVPAFVVLVGIPAALTLAAALGYYYTATEVLGRFFSTGVVALLAAVLYSLASRWVSLTRRRLAVEQAQRRLAEARKARLAAARKKARAAAKAGEPFEPEEEPTGQAEPELDESQIDFEAVTGQTRTLLLTLVGFAVAVALYGVWKDLLPALDGLSAFQLTPPTRNTDGEVIVRGLTLFSLLRAAVAAFLTWVAARNLPAVVELVVLQRFGLDAGTRYAASTLIRYVVVAAGAVVVSRQLGVDWSKAQWIVAALGVGLGFGLQEIVANFVSGLILLVERPVRVGDTVTVGAVTGTVSRLAIRATTITDFDNKEVLVPNKAYITDPVVNWTLSNPVTRLVVPVGVAYGSDVDRAQAVIAQAIGKSAAVLDEPAPSVFFLGFGDSALNFEVRCFVPELSRRLPTLHELHRAIHSGLAEAGIEIPFPQRDVHVREAAAPKGS